MKGKKLEILFLRNKRNIYRFYAIMCYHLLKLEDEILNYTSKYYRELEWGKMILNNS